MNELHEDRLPRIDIEERKGVWTTWGAPCTWGACLMRVDDGDTVGALSRCSAVAGLENVTMNVLRGTFTPPDCAWSLLVESPDQSWGTFADDCRYNEALDKLIADFDGEILRTGTVDDFGTVYVRRWCKGKQELEFTTDGMGWPTLPEDSDDDDEDENGEIFIFETDLYPADWPHSFDRVESAHQQLIIDCDAYVPGLAIVDGRLTAAKGHKDACEPDSITRATLVRLR